MFKKDPQFTTRRDLSRKESKGVWNRIKGIESVSSDHSSIISEGRVAAGDRFSIYFSKQDNEPLGFSIGSDEVIPSLYTLWQSVACIPTVWIGPAVSEFVLSGAKLMLPGVLRRGLPVDQFSFRPNDIVCVRVVGNPQPVAIGRALLSGEKMRLSSLDTKGAAVDIMHYFGDCLWKLGSRLVPPGFSFELVTQVAAREAEQRAPQLESPTTTEEVEKLTGEEMNSLAMASFFYVARTGSDSDLPMNTSALYSRMQTASKLILDSNACRKRLGIISRGVGRLDIRETKWRTFSTLIDQELKVYMKTKTVRNESIVASINREHPDIKAFILPAPTADETPVVGQGEPLVKVWFCLNSSWCRFFGVDKKEGNRRELNDLISEFLRGIRGGSVDLSVEKKLGEAMGVTADTKCLEKKEIMKMFNDSLITLYSITSEVPPRVRKGSPPKVKLERKKVAGNKVCTLLSGLAPYGLDQDEMAREISRIFSVSSSVTDKAAIYCQGDLVDPLVTFLVNSVGIPEDCIAR